MAETVAQKIARLAAKQYKDWKEKRFYETGAYRLPEDWIYVEHSTHSDWYNKNIINKFIKAANKYNIDPYDFIALGISETGLGNIGFSSDITPLEHENPVHINLKAHMGRIRSLIESGAYPNEKVKLSDIMIDYSAKYLSEQLKKYGDKLSGIQAFSGTGKQLAKGYSGWRLVPPPDWTFEKALKEEVQEMGYAPIVGRYFGRPETKIDFWKEKPQAKRVLDISSKLRGQPEIIDLIETLARSKL